MADFQHIKCKNQWKTWSNRRNFALYKEIWNVESNNGCLNSTITQERVSVGSSSVAEGWITWPAVYDNSSKSKCQRSRSQGHVTYQQLERYNLTVNGRICFKLRENYRRGADMFSVLSRSVGQIKQTGFEQLKHKINGNALKSPKFRTV